MEPIHAHPTNGAVMRYLLLAALCLTPLAAFGIEVHHLLAQVVSQIQIALGA